MKIIKNILKFSKLATFIFVMAGAVLLNTHASQAQTVEGAEGGIVICGKGNDIKDACTIDKLFEQANQFSGFVLKVIFPIVFFFGLFMVAWPLVNQFTGEANAVDVTEAKRRFKLLITGTIFTVGAFLIVKAVLSGLGYQEQDTILNPVDSTAKPTSFIFIERANAAEGDTFSFIPNPLADVNVQNVTLGVANVFVYIIIVCAIFGIVRGVMFLLLTQENPANIERGKRWIFGSLAAVAIVLASQLIYSIIVDTVSSALG